MITIAVFVVAGLIIGYKVCDEKDKKLIPIVWFVCACGLLGLVVSFILAFFLPVEIGEKENEHTLYPFYDRVSGEGPFLVEKSRRGYMVMSKQYGDSLPASEIWLNPANVTVEEIEDKQGLLEYYGFKQKPPWHLFSPGIFPSGSYKLLIPKNSINNKIPD